MFVDLLIVYVDPMVYSLKQQLKSEVFEKSTTNLSQVLIKPVIDPAQYV